MPSRRTTRIQDLFVRPEHVDGLAVIIRLRPLKLKLSGSDDKLLLAVRDNGAIGFAAAVVKSAAARLARRL